MSLSHTEIRRVVEEARPLLLGGRLQTITQPGPHTVVLTFYARQAKRHLLLAGAPQFARVHLVAERSPGTGEVAPFARSLRQGLRGWPLASLEAAADDRVVELIFGRPDAVAGRLVAELTGRTSNLYHVGPDGRLAALLRPAGRSGRRLRPGAPYEPPEPPPHQGRDGDRFAEAAAAAQDGDAPYSAAVARHYADAESAEAARSLRTSLAAHLRAARKKALRLLANLEADLAEAGEADHLRLCGELLKIHLARVPPRANRITVPNIFDPAAPDETIALLVNRSPRENMERYFRRYKKLTATRRQAERRAHETRQRIDSLDTQAVTVQEAATLEALESLAAELGRPPGRGASRRKPRERPAGPRRFVSEDGLDVLVGRTNAENDELTFRVARGNDLWFHVEGYTGSHVVVRVPRDKTAPRETVLDAATLAVHFSQLRRAGGGPVAYCACKYVTKQRGAGPGQVLYTQSRTLHVTVERSRMERLFRRDG